MVLIAVECPHCHSDDVGKGGKTSTGKQRYLCRNVACSSRTFILDYDYRGRQPTVKEQIIVIPLPLSAISMICSTVKEQIIEMALNGSGIRDTSRVLGVSTDTVLSELKKRRSARIGQYESVEGTESDRCHYRHSV